MSPDEFAERLDKALKVASLSRGQLAAALGVDKSVVSRWLSGVNRPSGHNLARLTTILAGRIAGFTMLDWEAAPGAFAARLGLSAPSPAGAPAADGADTLRFTDYVPASVVAEALAVTRVRGGAYEGFWRSTRPANDPEGGFIHDHILIRRSPEGLLRFTFGVYDLRFEGWALPIQTQLFCVACDPVSGIFLFCIFNAVLRERAEAMDGLTLTLQRSAGGAAVAAACLLERVGDLSGEDAMDEARFRQLANRDPVAAPGSIPAEVRAHLWKDVGPGAFARGGPALLTMAFAASLSRGSSTVSDRGAEDHGQAA